MLQSPAQPARPSESVSRIIGHYRRLGQKDALDVALKMVAGDVSKDVSKLLEGLQPAWADYAVASVYAALMEKGQRKKLGAYFTPPGLVDYLIARAGSMGVELSSQRVRDPAAGGAAFIVPIAREMVRRWRDEKLSDAKIIARLQKQLMGREIESGLAKLANALLRRCLVDEYGFAPSTVSALSLISQGDTLAIAKDSGADHELGNPPFLRLAARDEPEDFVRFDDISSGRLNLYAVFVRRGLEALPANGILAYIIPASFIGGPEFRKFRLRLRQLADVLAVDMINGRSTVFTNVVQDTCVLVLRKRPKEVPSFKSSWASSNAVSGDGSVASEGRIKLPAGDEAWMLPGAKVDLPSTLADWGYVPRIGYLVANRQSDRLHDRPAKGRVPLIWAKSIGQDGKFDFAKGVELRKHGWVDVPDGAPYVATQACVAIQRTSSRNQKKRITAAAIPAEFVAKHGGVVAENHVILLIPTGPGAASPDDLASALNRQDVSEQMDRMCGSASIPARLLAGMAMPARPRPSSKLP
ncbi:MAG: N-6 DNA methylase [Devosia sp.]|uniref:Eco57I restriction-modification methylase domain-containing protein n=1 Tax=Devosia sp. TaxID=1871048 RepID=UPI001A627FB8|nr:N-6 DNA methylase [Devosia sp.]MBL8597381.1 N-6 DNA methylase [Devosia sp.]